MEGEGKDKRGRRKGGERGNREREGEWEGGSSEGRRGRRKQDKGRSAGKREVDLSLSLSSGARFFSSHSCVLPFLVRTCSQDALRNDSCIPIRRNWCITVEFRVAQVSSSDQKRLTQFYCHSPHTRRCTSHDRLFYRG